jgi:nitrogen fixation NifU-like protein
MAYSQKVVQRFEDVLNNPSAHAVGRFDPKDPNVATGMVGAPACGDVMKLDLKLDDNDRILDVKFKTYGCGSAIASSTLFVEMLKGKTTNEAKLIKDKDIANALELPPIKLHCSVLAEGAISKAIVDWEAKKAKRQHKEGPK